MKLTIDPLTGMAGDMMIAALCDAGAAQDEVLAVIRFAAGLLGKADVRLENVRTQAVTGSRLRVAYQHDRPGRPAGIIREKLENVYREFSFTAAEKKFADTAFHTLCHAEAQAHASFAKPEKSPHEHPPAHGGEGVHLHEAQDILVDICGTARALSLLNADMTDIICLAPVFYGGGAITFSHGTFSVPAPATQAIINTHHIPVQAGPVPRELLTPTGAAVLAALTSGYGPRSDGPALPQAVMGTGLGSLEFDPGSGAVNGLRVILHQS